MPAMPKKTKILPLFIAFLFLLLVFGIEHELKAKTTPQTPQEYYHINSRPVFQGQQAAKITAIKSIVNAAKKQCKDVLDDDGKVIEEGFFEYNFTTNYFAVEYDYESGYVIGDGKIVIHYKKKCPDSWTSKLFKNEGDVVMNISAKGRVRGKGANAKAYGNINVDLSIPTLIPFKMRFTDAWAPPCYRDHIGPFNISLNLEKFGLKTECPIHVKFNQVSSPDELKLIKFKILEEEPEVTFLPPARRALIANGQDKQTFTVHLKQKAILENEKNHDIIDDSYEGELEGIDFDLETTIDRLDSPTPIKNLEGTYQGLPLKTNSQGKASFIYTAPRVEDKKFTGAIVNFIAQSSQGDVELSIDLKPMLGEIKGRLVDINGKVFKALDVKASLKYPSMTVVQYPPWFRKVPTSLRQEIKAGQSDFVFNPVIPAEKGYALSLGVPLGQGYIPRNYQNLPSIIDLGNIIIARPEDYEKQAMDEVKKMLRKAGISDLVGDVLDNIRFEYTETRGPEYKDGVIYLPNKENFWRDANTESMETFYHELFHPIHSRLAELDWLHTAVHLGGEHKMWEESSEYVAFDEAISHFFGRLMMLNQNIGFRPEDYSKISVSEGIADKNGNLVEGKITAFLVDYYKYSGLKPGEILKDFFSSMKTYRKLAKPGGDMGHCTYTIAEWIMTKLYEDPTNYRINALLEKHKIDLDTMANLTTFDLLKKSYENKRDKLEGNKPKEKQTTKTGENKRHKTSPYGKVGKNTTHKIKPRSTYHFVSGRAQLAEGKIEVRNGGAVDTTQAMVTDISTVYSVEALMNKTIVKVAQGKVEIMNRQTKEIYLAERGEKVEIYGDKIVTAAIFNPKTDPDFKRDLLDYFYEYFNWVNLMIGGGGLLVLIIIFLVIKKKRKNKGRVK